MKPGNLRAERPVNTELKFGNLAPAAGEIAEVNKIAPRIALVSAGLLLAALLLTARMVEPAADGFGTHQKLGLPPCGFRFVFGRPCPSCGMTTSWSLLARGQLWLSAQANAGGMLLGLACIVAIPWMILSGLRGKWFLAAPALTPISAVGIAIVITTIVNWLIALFA
jgi:hypothetical protein